MTDELDDLLSSPVSAPTHKPAPVNFPSDEHDALAEILRTDGLPDMALLKRPMTLTNIATLLGKEPRRVYKMLANCPVISYAMHKGKQSPLYDLKTAIDYIATPTVSQIRNWFFSQSTATLPPILAESMWKAEKTKIAVMEAAGELWHTEDVQRVFGKCQKEIKDATTIWVESLPGAQQMTTEQYDAIRKQVNALQDEIYKIMIAEPAERPVRPYREVLQDMLDAEVPAYAKADEDE